MAKRSSTLVVVANAKHDNDNGNNDDESEKTTLQLLLPIEKFRLLMGNLYGVAGMAHAADCYLGSSQLLVAAGSPEVSVLPPAGQGLVALWCAAGPVAFVTSRIRGGIAADAGLLFYGVVEVVGAAILVQSLPGGGGGGGVVVVPEINALTNAVLVQSLVLASWIYSRQQQKG